MGLLLGLKNLFKRKCHNCEILEGQLRNYRESAKEYFLNKAKNNKNKINRGGIRRITDEQIRLIKQLAQDGYPTEKISKMMGFSVSTIYDILNGIRYKEIN